MSQLYHFIDNRIYGDYYKLFVMISESLNSQLSKVQLSKLKELQHLNKYPQYKDLEPFIKELLDAMIDRSKTNETIHFGCLMCSSFKR